jgi:hypothetical protein
MTPSRRALSWTQSSSKLWSKVLDGMFLLRLTALTSILKRACIEADERYPSKDQYIYNYAPYKNV